VKKEQVMAQDDRKQRPPASRGRSPAPNAPDIPDMKAIHAPPPPEPPVTQPTAAAAPAPPAGQPSPAAEGDDATGRLEQAVEAAQKALKEKQDALARYKEQREADKAAAKLVDDYAAEEDALKRAGRDLEQYQVAETSFLSKFLDAATMEKIADAAKTAQAEIDALAATVASHEASAAAKRKARDDARAAADDARRKAEALKRPAASIRERLKAADAIRTEAMKASDAGKYALAYWLIMPGGKLDQAIKAEPHILDHEALRAQVTIGRKAQDDSEQALALSEQELKQAEDALRDEQVRLVDLRRKFDATVLDEVAALNPTIVKAA
jgi:colicin import membrane protein